MLPTAQRFPLETLERAISVLSFIVGSFIGGRIGARMGASTRGWLAVSALGQSLSLWGAAAILLALPDDVQPSFQYWPPIIMFTAFAMGLQSVTAQKLSSPAFATVGICRSSKACRDNCEKPSLTCSIFPLNRLSRSQQP